MVRLGSQTKNETLKGLEVASHPRYKEPIQSSRDVREQQWRAIHDPLDFVDEVNDGSFRFFNRDLELDLASLPFTLPLSITRGLFLHVRCSSNLSAKQTNRLFLANRRCLQQAEVAKQPEVPDPGVPLNRNICSTMPTMTMIGKR